MSKVPFCEDTGENNQIWGYEGNLYKFVGKHELRMKEKEREREREKGGRRDRKGGRREQRKDRLLLKLLNRSQRETQAEAQRSKGV